jgi:hypothetical protein
MLIAMKISERTASACAADSLSAIKARVNGTAISFKAWLICPITLAVCSLMLKIKAMKVLRYN